MLWQGLSEPVETARNIHGNESSDAPSFSTVAIHAWSTFDGKRASDAAVLMASELEERFHIVSVQELIWRLRMTERRDQTPEFLASIR